MGGSGEKSLSDWMVRQGMVRRGHQRAGAATRRVPPSDTIGGNGTVRPRGEQGPPGGTRHGPTPSAPPSRDPRCPLPAPDWEARPRAAEGPGARLAVGQQEAEWQRELLWEAQSACCWEVGSCLFSGLLAAHWGLRCWGQSLGMELAWLEKDSLSLSFPN